MGGALSPWSRPSNRKLLSSWRKIQWPWPHCSHGTIPLSLHLKKALGLPERSQRVLSSLWIPDGSIRSPSLWGSRDFRAGFQASPALGRKSLSHIEPVGTWVSKSAPPSPAAGLGLGDDEGSSGYSCPGIGPRPLDPAGLGQGDQRWWEGPHFLSPLRLDPCCCKVALILALSPLPWLFGFAGASGRVHSCKLGERPHSSGSDRFPACSTRSRRW